MDNKQREFDDDLFNLLQDERFRNVIWWILEQAQIYQTTFTGNSNGMFMEGKRSLGLQILDTINASDPNAFITMMQKSLNQSIEENS